MIAQYGYNLVDFSTDEEKLVITAHDQWEMFMDQDNNKGVRVEKLVTVDTSGKVVTGDSSLPTHEAFVPDTTAVVDTTVADTAAADTAK